jgi:hypothetical protein
MALLLLPLQHTTAGMLNTKTGAKLTTVRGTDKLPAPMKLLTRAYAFYQFSAIASHIIPSDRTMVSVAHVFGVADRCAWDGIGARAR